MQTSTETAQFGVESENGGARYALPMILLGLLAPALALFIVDPRALMNVSVVMHIYLAAIFLIAAGAYFISLFETGEVTRVTVNGKTRLVVIERTGLLAKSASEIRFEDIASVRVETRYDDDGYETAIPVIILTTRETVPLPAGTSESEVATMRALLNRR